MIDYDKNGFKERNKNDFTCEGNHDWWRFVHHELCSEPQAAIAICLKCAKLSSGWVVEVKND